MQRTRDEGDGNKKNSLSVVEKIFTFIEANKSTPVCFAIAMLPRSLSVKVKQAEARLNAAILFFACF